MSILYNASQLVIPSCTKLLAFSVNTKMNRGLLNVHTIWLYELIKQAFFNFCSLSYKAKWFYHAVFKSFHSQIL